MFLNQSQFNAIAGPQVYSLQRQTEHRRTSTVVYTASNNQPL